MDASARRNILLVEDEAIVALACARSLQSFGYAVTTANSGERAVELALGGSRFDLILMDIDLGRGMDGTEAARRILAEIELPIVFLTSHSEEAYVGRVKKITRYGYVIKNSGDFVLRSSLEMAFELFEANAKYRKKVAELEKSEESLAVTLHSIGDAVITTDPESRIGRMNRTAERLTGWSAEEARGLPLATVFRILDAETRVAAEDPVGRVLRSGGVVAMGNRTVLVGRDGREYHIADSAAPIRDGRGVVHGVILVFSDISASYEAQERLRESERRFKSIVNSSPMGMHIYELDPEGDLRFIGANPAADAILALDNSAFVGKTIEEAFPALRASEIPRQYKRVAATGGSWTQEQVDYEGSNIRGAFEVVAFQISPRVMSAMFFDITRRKRVEAALSESEAYLGGILETIPLPIFVKNMEGKYLRINRAFAELVGRSEAEILGSDAFALFPPEFASIYQEWDDKLFREGGTQIYETNFKNAEGSLRVLRAYKVGFADSKGTVAGIIGIVEDITERSRAEEALQASERNYREIFNSTSEAIFIHDAATGKILDVNDAVLRMYGYESKEEILAGDVGDLSSGESDFTEEAAQRNMHRVKAEGPLTIEWRARRRDGSLFWTEISLRRTSIGGENRILAVGRDISERRRAAERVAKLLEEKDILLKEVHHRIKNNMNTVISLLSLQAGARKEESVRAALADAGNRVRSMMVLYDKLYLGSDFGEILLGDYLPDLMDEIVGNFPNAAMVRTVKNIEPIVMDAKRISVVGMIVNELVVNAMKYAFRDREGGLITLSVGTLPDGRIGLVVEDDGAGLPAGIGLGSSTGFGLMLVDLLMQQLEGTAKIEPGTGTKIVLEFAP